jgi:FLVCR family feline leukemia virus subgroup C receptor-related protein
VFFRDKPPTPANRIGRIVVEKNYRSSIRAISRNWNLFIVAFLYGTLIASMNVAATVGGEITGYFGFTTKQASYFGISLIIGGLIGSVVSGIILTKTKKFKLLAICCAGGSLIARLVMSYSYHLNLAWFTVLCSIFSGFFTLPLIPLCYELGVEITHPIDETFSASVITIAEILMSILMNSVCSNLISKHGKDGSIDTLYVFIGM